MQIAFVVVVFACVFAAVMALYAATRPRAAGQRLQGLASAPVGPAPERVSLVRGDDRNWLMRSLHKLGTSTGDRDDAEGRRLRDRMTHAGFYGPFATGVYTGVRLVLAIGLPLIVASVPVMWGLEPALRILALCTIAAVAYLLPSFWLDSRIKRRQQSIERALPDALDLMVVCVEAGFGINQALARVSDEFALKSPLLATEFGLVVSECRAGKSTQEALRGLSDRTGVSDISSLVALLVQTERFGTSIATALRVHADSMRVKRMQRAEERAQMATLKLILPSTLIFTALLMIFLVPGIARFMTAFPD